MIKNIILLLLGMEVFLAIFWKLRHKIDEPDRSDADAYHGAEWVRGFYKECLMASVMRWHPYTYWRRKEFFGKYVNIDFKGIRHTLDGEVAHKIFVFGGSTVWGTGVRDDYTLPSCVARLTGAVVTNFGESGYTSTQEIICLIQELKNGNIPNTVIFYDGINDVHAAYQSNHAGLTDNEINRKREFNILHPARRMELYGYSLKFLIGDSMTLKLVRKFLGKKAEHRSVGHRLAQRIANNYIVNMRLVFALAREYGFKPLFYWHPTIYDKGCPTNYEKNRAKEWVFLAQLWADTQMFLRKCPDIRVLSDVFRGVEEPLYIDFCHVAEHGNELIAGEICKDLKIN